MKTQYIICGMHPTLGECLVSVCGEDPAYAEEALERMKNNPTDIDKRLIGEKTNLCIKEVTDYIDAWWLWDFS